MYVHNLVKELEQDKKVVQRNDKKKRKGNKKQKKILRIKKYIKTCASSVQE